MEENSRSSVKAKIDKALSKLFERDAFLLQNNVNERTITHQFANYLQEEFPEWDVDCEYNRNHGEIKRLRRLIRESSNNDTDGDSIYPDIIIHHRDTDDNFLVIEVKKSTNLETSKGDTEKLAGCKEELGYQHALFLRLLTASENLELTDAFWINVQDGRIEHEPYY